MTETNTKMPVNDRWMPDVTGKVIEQPIDFSAKTFDWPPTLWRCR